MINIRVKSTRLDSLNHKVRNLLFILILLTINSLAQQSKVDSLENILNLTNDPITKVDALLHLVELNGVKSLDKSKDYCNQALKISKENNYEKGYAEALRDIAYIHRRKGNFDLSLQYLDSAQKYNTEHFDSLRLSLTYNSIGSVCHELAKYKEALENFENSLKYLPEGQAYNLANTMANISIIYLELEDYEKALEYIIRTNEVCEKNDLRSLLAKSYSKLAYVHSKTGDNENALKYYKKSVEISESIGDDFSMAFTYLSIGNFYGKTNDVINSEKYYKLSREKAEIVNHKRLLVNVILNLSSLNKGQGNFEKGIEYANEAYKLSGEFKIPKEQVNAASLLAEFYIAQKKNKSAIKYLRKAEEIGKKSNSKSTLVYTYRLLSKAYASDGDYRKAYKVRLIHNSLKDSLDNVSKEEAVAEMSAKYETELKEKEIEKQQLDIEKKKIQLEKNDLEISRKDTLNITLGLGIGLSFLILIILFLAIRKTRRMNKTLSYKNDEIQLQKEEIETQAEELLTNNNQLIDLNSTVTQQKEEVLQQKAIIEKTLSEKELLLKEIHHRVKNNLQIISSLLDMQSTKIEDKDALSIVSDGQNRVKAMALIHQKLYQNKDIAMINFQEYLEQLVNQLEELYTGRGTIIKKVNANALEFDIDTAIPLGLIVNELISNIFKHAFKEIEQGEVSVSIEALPNQGYTLTIKDNGVGMPSGFSLENSKSLGLRLVNGLSNQLLGDVNYEYENGSIFRIKFEDTISRKKIE